MDKRGKMRKRKHAKSMEDMVEDKDDCRSYVFDHWKRMSAAGGDANKISEGIIAANKAFGENTAPKVVVAVG
jgi:hypothetical protein